jgi:hypothetical protein
MRAHLNEHLLVLAVIALLGASVVAAVVRVATMVRAAENATLNTKMPAARDSSPS